MRSWDVPAASMAHQPDAIRVRVVYALPDKQPEVSLVLGAGARVSDALEGSGLAGRYGLDLAELKCAIFGRQVTLSDMLLDGDRVEILRPLAADPKQARRQAAASSRQSSRGRR